MIRTFFKIGALALLVAVSLSTPIVSAQIPASPDGLTISSSASTPAPGQPITITAASYTTNIDASTITWTANGKILQKGVGLTTLDLTTPALGKKLTIVVTAVSPQGGQTSGSIIINPSAVDLIVETDGAVPTGFLGKASPAYQNSVKVIAMPHLVNSSGIEYDPKTLTYTWKKDDGTVIKDQSGYGKQSVTIPGSIIPRPYSVIVSVASRDGTAQGQSIVDITPVAPSVIFYPDDPLYGPLFNIAFGPSIHIGSQKETSILAGLFGFNGSPSYSWSINGTTRTELADKRTIVLRAPENTSGVSSVNLELASDANILQQAKAGFSASFDTTGKSSGATNVAF